jgi:hypothetical protein
MTSARNETCCRSRYKKFVNGSHHCTVANRVTDHETRIDAVASRSAFPNPHHLIPTALKFIRHRLDGDSKPSS